MAKGADENGKRTVRIDSGNPCKPEQDKGLESSSAGRFLQVCTIEKAIEKESG